MVVSIPSDEFGSLEMPGKPVKFAGEEEEPLRKAPGAGEHNAQIYAALDIDPAKMESLKNEGVI